MLIYCTHCQQGYEIEESLIPENGCKLRCSSCKKVFTYNKTSNALTEKLPSLDAEKEIKEEDEPVNISDIFERLSEQTIGLFEKEKKLSKKERFWLKVKTLSGWNLKINIKYIISFLIIVILISLYNNRYDITRKIPFTASLYGIFGIESQVLGEGLEFQNIDWVYFDDNNNQRLEIKGFINNSTKRSIKLPIVHIEMLDANTGLLKSQNQKLNRDSLKANSRINLNIIVDNPSPTTKYIFLTFVENE